MQYLRSSTACGLLNVQQTDVFFELLVVSDEGYLPAMINQATFNKLIPRMAALLEFVDNLNRLNSVRNVYL